MGYQITQYDQPIIIGGKVEIETVGGKKKTIGITRAHLEADAGKSLHPTSRDYSQVDLNRAGTPLLEIVSEPDMHSAAEAKNYIRELYLRMKYAGVSDANLYYGNMRFDVNVSVSQDVSKLGTRTETKNLNSFRAVEKVIDFEMDRQIELIEKDQPIIQETRGWDDAKQKTISQRIKENADDYRYMPDPDIPPVILDKEYIETVKAEMPVMPSEWRIRLNRLGIDKIHIETLLDAEVEDGQASYLSLIDKNLTKPETAKYMANWFVNLEIPLRREAKLSSQFSDGDRLAIYTGVYSLLKSDKLSSTSAKSLLTKLLEQDSIPKNIAAYAKANGLIQESNTKAISKIVDQVIQANPKAAADVKSGEAKATQFLIGQVMKLSRGQANPQLAQDMINRKLRA